MTLRPLQKEEWARVWNHSVGKPLAVRAECSGSLEDKDAETVAMWTVDHESSERTKDSIRNWLRDHLCDSLAKDLALFCQLP